MNSRKMMKLLILTITSLLIASASAQLYSQMFMYSHVTVQGNFVKFVAGANTTDVGGTITPGGEEVTFSNMIGKNGSLVTYEQAVNITNLANDPHNVELKYYNWNGDTKTTLRYIDITMYDKTGTQKGTTVHLVPGAGDVTTSGQVSIPASSTWRVQWDVFWWANASLTDTVDVTLVLLAW